MSRLVQFVTPENIEVNYELAGIGSRFLAAFIDHLFQLVLILAAWFAMSLVSSALSFGRMFGGASPLWAQAVLGLLIFSILFGYFTTFEILWAGRTPGKRVAGVRVVRDNGYPIDAYSSLVRNLVRILDFLPPPYAAGLTAIFLSSEYKRLGDFAAGTIVIKERPYSPPAAPAAKPLPPLALTFSALIRDIDALGADEYLLIRRFLDRREEMDLAAQSHVAMRLGQPILPRLGIYFPIPVQSHYVDALLAIANRYIEERSPAESVNPTIILNA